jgi:hypothetical protein
MLRILPVSTEVLSSAVIAFLKLVPLHKRKNKEHTEFVWEHCAKEFIYLWFNDAVSSSD